MKQNNVIIAPQIADTATLFEAWAEENFGTEERFYQIMTTPSPERTTFLAEHSVELSHDGNFVTQNYSV